MSVSKFPRYIFLTVVTGSHVPKSNTKLWEKLQSRLLVNMLGAPPCSPINYGLFCVNPLFSESFLYLQLQMFTQISLHQLLQIASLSLTVTITDHRQEVWLWKGKGMGELCCQTYFNPSSLHASEIMCLQHIKLSHKPSYLSTGYRNSTERVALV